MIDFVQTVYKERTKLNETKDCTVRALAATTGMTYLEAHALCAEFGRKHRKGFHPDGMLRSLTQRGFEVTEVKVLPPTYVRRENLYYGTSRVSRRGGDTVASIIARLPKRGAFYLCSSTHAFAYVDGKVHDMGRVRPRAKMETAHEIKKAQNTAMTQAQINELWARLDRLEGKA